MGMIYLTDEVQKELDEALEEYNEKNAPTDRSGIVLQLLRNTAKHKPKKEEK